MEMLRKQRRVRWCSLIGSIMRIQCAEEEIVFSISNKCSPSVTYQSNVDPPTLCTLSIEATLCFLSRFNVVAFDASL